MAIFDFKCENCGNVVEKITSSETRWVECDNCGDKAFKQVSAPAYINGGFYDAAKLEKSKTIEALEEKTNKSLGGH